MIIHSRFKDYKILFENDFSFLKPLIAKENSLLVVDENVFHLYEEYFSETIQNNIYVVRATEEKKVIDTALDICERMTGIPAKKNATVISIGGGIIQDLTGFVANILYRGVNWIFVPTTLLAASDSCIGGKTSLNYKQFKNLLGTFYPPDEIYICPEFFKTLAEKDFKSGLGEVVKFNIMAGQDGLKNMESHLPSLLNRDNSTVTNFVRSSLNFKKDFIELDEFDRGERIKLNFAHTFGHAIETVTHYAIPHGTAVAIGMIMADSISVKRGLLSEDIAKRSEEVLLKIIDIDADLSSYPLANFISAMRKDKKQTSDKLTAVLMTNTAKDLRIVKDLSEEEVKDAIKYFSDIYNVR